MSSQRTHFETLLASREVTTAHCLRYFTHERNLTALLQKRLARQKLGGKAAQKLRQHRQQHLFSILERSTRRFHGDLRLWAQLLEYCREQGASRRLQLAITEICRLHPTRGEVWEWAARDAETRGDVAQARGFWLRGCRFCTRDWRLRVAFAQAEMRWVVRARETLGIKKGEKAEEEQDADEDEVHDADLIALPSGDQEPKQVAAPDSQQDFSKFSATPAMSGAIPMAVFDSAMTATDYNEDAIEEFFSMFAEFPRVPCTPSILQHVLEAVEGQRPKSPALHSCKCRQLVLGLEPDSPEFPGALRASLAQVKISLATAKPTSSLAKRLLEWLKPLSEDERLIPELKQVVNATCKRLAKLASA